MLATVTGASGHLGSNLIRILLSREWQVRALAHSNTRTLEGLNIECTGGDILSLESLEEAFRDTDYVFHLAARISITSRDRDLVERINITGVRNVIDACRSTGVKRLIHISSFHALTQEPLDEPLDETRPLYSAGRYPPYNYSKAEGEKLVRKAETGGLDSVIIYPTGMFGPLDFRPSFFGATLLAMAQGTLPALVNAGLNWADVRDVAEGITRAAEYAESGERFILGGHWVSLPDIAGQIADICKSKPAGIVLPLRVAKSLAPFSEFTGRLLKRQPRFTPISIKELESNPDIRYTRARERLQYEPRPFRESLSDTLAWFEENGFLER